MQEFLAFIDKVRAQTRASSHSALAMCPSSSPSHPDEPAYQPNWPHSPTLPAPSSQPCTACKIIYIFSPAKRGPQKKGAREVLEAVGRRKWKELGESGTRAPINYLPFVHLSHTLPSFVMGHMSIFCICAANWPILWHLFIALRAGRGVLGAGTYHLP